MRHHNSDLSGFLLNVGVALLLVATMPGCQTTEPGLPEPGLTEPGLPEPGLTDAGSDPAPPAANVSGPGLLRRRVSPGLGSGLSDEAREIEQRFGYK
jgi:hypothetical protein